MQEEKAPPARKPVADEWGPRPDVSNTPGPYDGHPAVPHHILNEAAPQVDDSHEMWQNGLEIVAMAVPEEALEQVAAKVAEKIAAKALPGVARLGKLTQEAVEHIALRHFPTSGATKAGKFASNSLRELRTLVNETVARGTIRPNTLGRPVNIFELNFGRQIGTDVAGNAASRLRVVVTPEGVVKTAFPF